MIRFPFLAFCAMLKFQAPEGVALRRLFQEGTIMKRIFISVLAGLLCLQAPMALGQETEHTTNQMLSFCDGTSEFGIEGEAYCTGYVNAILDMGIIWELLGTDPFFCSPEIGISANEALVAVESFARRNPEQYEELFLLSLLLALSEKYPC